MSPHSNYRVKIIKECFLNKQEGMFQRKLKLSTKSQLHFQKSIRNTSLCSTSEGSTILTGDEQQELFAPEVMTPVKSSPSETEESKLLASIADCETQLIGMVLMIP